MLDRKDVKKGERYLLGGKVVVVYMIHRPNNGESVSLHDPIPDGTIDTWPYHHKQTMQMRKFQKAATIMPEVQG